MDKVMKDDVTIKITLLLVVTVMLGAQLLTFSSAVSKHSDANTYYVGDIVTVALEDFESSVIKIETPSYTKNVIPESDKFLFVPREVGEYSILVKSDVDVYSYSFYVSPSGVDTSDSAFLDNRDSLVDDEEEETPELDLNETEIHNKTETEENNYSNLNQTEHDNVVFERTINENSNPDGEEDPDYIEIGELVKNVIAVSDANGKTVKIHKDATNITVKSSGGEVYPYELVSSLTDNLFGALSISTDVSLILSEVPDEVEIIYFTPGPEMEENVISPLKKEITVSSLPGLHYEHVLGETNVSEMILVERSDLIRVYWKEESRFLEFEANDTNNNGLIDKITWVVPHLSEQTFEIIFIEKALHLDDNKEFIADVFLNVSEQDGVWQYIPNGEYIRVTFEENLTNERDITLYAKSASNDSVTVEIYEEGSDELLAVIDNILLEGFYKVFLTQLVGIQQVFDLKFIGDIYIDWIVDPVFFVTHFTGFEADATAPWDGWVDGGSDMSRSTSLSTCTDTVCAGGGSASLQIGDNSGSSYTQQTFDLSAICGGYACDYINLTFWVNYEANIDAGEELDVMCDGTTIWSCYPENNDDPADDTVQCSGTGNLGVWKFHNINLSNPEFGSCTIDSSVTIRFESEYSANGENSWIDGINISGYISNLPPNQSIPVVNSSLGTNFTKENLTVYNLSTADQDGDAVTNIISWYMNSTPIMLVNMPFDFDDSAGVNVTKDYSGNNFTGQLGGAADGDGNEPAWTSSGYLGGAYTFSGSDYIAIEDFFYVANSQPTEVTVMAWIQTSDTAGIIATYDRNEFWRLEVGGFANNGALGFQVFTDAGQLDWTTSTTVNDNTWHHVAGTFDNGNASMYIDGVLVNTTTSGNYMAGDVNRYGCIGSNSESTTFDLDCLGNHLAGTIDEVKIFNRSLSASQIRALYNNRTDLIVANDTNVSDVWSACITPHDGTIDGLQNCSNALTVLPVPDVVNITINPGLVNGSIFSDFTPKLNVTLSSHADTVWYNINNGANVTLCTNCNSTIARFIVLNETTSEVNLFANNTAGDLTKNSTNVTVDMNFSFYDTFDDNSSIELYDNSTTVIWNFGNVTFNGSTSYLDDDFDDGSFSDSSPITWTPVDDGGTCSWTIISGVLTESSNCNDGDRDGDAFGGYIYADNQTWTDYNLSAQLRSTDNDGMGMMFRFINNTHYYRVRFEGTSNYRRLERVQNGVVTILDSDSLVDGGLTEDNWHNVTVKVNGNSIDVYLNGVRVLNATDSAIPYGSVAMYSWGQDAGSLGSDFDNVTVNLLQATGGMTSYILNTSSNIAEITNVTWTEGGTDATNNITIEISADGGSTWQNATNNEGIISITSGTSLLYRANFTLDGTGASSVSLLDLNITWSNTTDAPPQIKIHSPLNGTTIDDYTPLLNVTLNETAYSLWYNINDGANITLCELCTGTHSTYVVLNESLNLINVYSNNSLGVENRNFTNFTVNLGFNDYDSYDDNASIELFTNVTWQSGNISFTMPGRSRLLLNDTFDDGSHTDGSPITWTAVSNAAGCSWSVVSNVLTESSNCNDGDRDGDAFGGYVYAANQTWQNYNLSAMLRSTDNDGMGMMFRYINDTDYYRVRFEGTSNYRRLERVQGGSVTVLDSDSLADGGLTEDSWHNVTVRVQGSSIDVFLNGPVVLSATDTAHSYGSVAMYSWGQDAGSLGSDFDNVSVTQFITQGNYTSYIINTSTTVAEVLNVTWTESGTTAGNNVTVQVSADAGGTWHDATNGEAILGIVTGSGLVYRALFETNGTNFDTLSMLDFNLTWSNQTNPAPNMAIHAPLNATTFADVTPLLNVTLDGLADTFWYNLNDGPNITICSSCTGTRAIFVYVNESGYTLNLYTNNSVGEEKSNFTNFTVDMNFNYYDNFDDNSSIQTYNNVTWQVGNVSFLGATVETTLLDDPFTDSTDWTLTGGSWAASGGTLTQSGNAADTTAIYDLINLSAGENYNISMLTYDDDNDGTGIIFRYRNSTDYYRCIFNLQGGTGSLQRIKAGSATTIASTGSVYTENAFNNYTVGIFSNNISCFLNGVMVMSATDSTWEDGQVGIYNHFHQAADYDDYFVEQIDYLFDANFTAYSINTTSTIVEISNVTWTESGTDANNNLTVQISPDYGSNWYDATNNEGIFGIATGDRLVYRVLYHSNGSNTVTLDDMNITWSSTASAPPNISINTPVNGSTIADVTPTLNVTLDGSATTLWYNVNNGANVTICNDCSGTQSIYLYLAEGGYTVNVYTDNVLGVENSNLTNFTIDMNYNYYDNYDDNSSLLENQMHNVTWEVGSVNFTTTASLLLLEEQFSSIDNWITSGGTWGITSEQLHQSSNSAGTTALYNGTNLSTGKDYNISMVAYDDDNDGTGIIFRYRNSTDYYRCFFNLQGNSGVLQRIQSGSTSTLDSTTTTYTENAFNNYTVDIIGNNISCYVNGAFLLSAVDSTWEDGQFGIYNNFHDEALYDNFTVRELVSTGTGNFTAYKINTTNPVAEILNVTWNETGTDANNNITVQLSVNGGSTWYNITKNQGLTGFSAGSTLIHRVLFSRNQSGMISLLDMNISWTDTTAAAPNITIHAPLINGSTTADVTPTLNVTIDGPATTLWYNTDGVTNTTICTDCSTGTYTSFLYLTEGDFTVRVYTNNSLGERNSNTSNFTVDMNRNYFDTFDDNSSLLSSQMHNIVYSVGNVSFTFNDSHQLFEDTFDDGSFSDSSPINWTPVSNAAGCSWAIVSNVLTESTNCNDGDRDGDAFGGYIYADNQTWEDYNVTAMLRSTDNDGMGMMFRYINDTDYYRVRFEGTSNYRRLERVQNGVVTVLDSDSLVDGGLTEDNWHNVTVRVQGSSIDVFLNGANVLTATDSAFSYGSVAMYSWGQDAGTLGSDFDNVTVTQFVNSGNFTIYEANTTQPIQKIANITWTESGNGANDNLTIQLSVDYGVTWFNVTNGEEASGFTAGSSLVYRALFSTNGTDTTPITLLDINITWVAPPVITIFYPLNITYTSLITDLNYTSVPGPGLSLDECWFTNDTGVTNYTLTCNQNLTDRDSVEGQNRWTIYSNDTDGGVGQATIFFRVDTSAPTITFINQTDTDEFLVNDTNPLFEGDNLTINVNITDDNVDSVWVIVWESVVGGTQQAKVFFTYVAGFLWKAVIPTDYLWSNTFYNYTIYANDTVNFTSTLDRNFTLLKINSDIELSPNPSDGIVNVTATGNLQFTNSSYVLDFPINLWLNGTLLLFANVTPVGPGSYNNYRNFTANTSSEFDLGTYYQTTTDGDNITLSGSNTTGNYTRTLDAGARVEWDSVFWQSTGQACAATLTWQEGVDSFSDTYDSYIDGSSPNSNYGSNAALLVDTSPTQRSIIKFDMIGNGRNKIPFNATIFDANITVNVYDAGNPITVYEILENWSEDDVTYNNRLSGTAWGSTGLAGSPSRSTVSEDSFSPSATGNYTFNITKAMKFWVNQSHENYGVVLNPGGTNDVNIRSSDYSEVAFRPLLTASFNSSDCTSVLVYTRVSNNGSTWTNWQQVDSHGQINDPHTASRYLQYRIELTSLNDTQTPYVEDFVVNYTAITTNSTGGFSYNFSSPTDFGVYPIEVNTTYQTIRTNASASLSVQAGVSPQVVLISPANATWLNDGYFNFTFNATDANLDLFNASLILNGTYNQSNSTPLVNAEYNNLTVNLSSGVYNWTINLTDATSNTVTNVTWLVYVDLIDPEISQVFPPNGSSYTLNEVNLSFNVTDNMDGSLICNVTLDNSLIHTNQAVANATDVNFTSGTLTAGLHYWNVTCIDEALNINISETWQFNLTDTPPNVSLWWPANDYVDSDGNISFEFNVTDNSGILNCSLIINGTDYTTNQTIVDFSAEDSHNIINRTGLPEGSYNWTVGCYDLSSTYHEATHRNFTVDLNPPTIDLLLPSDAFVTNKSDVNFNFTVNDTMDSSLICNLTINNVIVDSEFSATNATVTNRLISSLTDGQKYWNLTCIDDAGHTGSSLTRTVNVTEPPHIFLNITNGTSFPTDTVTLDYTPYDNTNLTNCSVYLNGAYNSSNASAIANDAQNSFVVEGLQDGTYDWYVNCTDTINLFNVSSTRTFFVDAQPPTMQLFFPNGHDVYAENITFNFTVIDQIDSTLLCNLSVNGTIMDQNFTVNNDTITNRTVAGITDGFHDWNLNCSDSAGNINGSLLYNFTKLTTPGVTLSYPETNHWFNESTFNLTYVASDDQGFLASYLVINNVINRSNDTIINNEAPTNFSITSFPNGAYNWSVNVTDITGLNGSSSTRLFYVDTILPTISLHSPINDSLIETNNITFNFTAIDNLAPNITCNLSIDGEVEYSGNSTNGSVVTQYLLIVDGNHTWSVLCTDIAGHVNVSEIRNFTVEAPPNVTLDSPPAGNRTTASSINFTYTPIDPIGINSCSIYLDGVLNQTDNAPVPNVPNNFTITGISEGVHNWTVNCTDPDLNTYAPPAITFIRDITPPFIALEVPVNNSMIDLNDNQITFTWNATDALDGLLYCNLSVDDLVTDANLLTTSGLFRSENVDTSAIGSGWHNWSVTCWDQVDNTNTSVYWYFNLTYPDLEINETLIYFNTTEVGEGEALLITAQVFNGEGADAEAVTVQFYDGDPADGGTQINSNYTINVSSFNYANVSTIWTTDIGPSDIYVVVDPNVTLNGSLTESNESNNIGNRSIHVGAWHTFYGFVSADSEFILADNDNSSIVRWMLNAFDYGNLYFTDFESTVSWLDLQAIGYNNTSQAVSGDFADIDTLINMTSFNDSVYNTFTTSGTPKASESFTVFSQTIPNVPVINSTNVTSFKTGILWDTSDDTNTEYDTVNKEDVVFVTKLNKSTAGAYGTYDYEIRVPARLRQYYTADTVSGIFYVEIK